MLGRTASASEPLVGRDEELSLLRRAYHDVAEGVGSRIVTLVGPQGIGKRRLISELTQELGAGPLPARVCEGRPAAQSAAYGMFASLLRSRFEIPEGTESDVARTRLHAQVSAVLGDRRVGDVCYFLGELMGLAFAESPLTRAVADDPSQARLLRRAVVRSFIEADAAKSCVCLVLYDLHATDEDSLELLAYLLENLRAKILVLGTARPEFLSRHPEWSTLGGSRHALLELGPLSEDDSLTILQRLLAACHGGPPPRLLEAAISMAGGTPGHLVHMVRVFRDAEVLVGNELEGFRVDLDRLASARLPLTVADAVELRILALAPHERRLLEYAAALGSVFWLNALVALTRIDRDPPEFWTRESLEDRERVKRTLTDLEQRDYVLRLPDSAFAGESEFVFKHNLERESLGRLTPAATTRRYHQTIADWLAQKETVRSQEEYTAMLARHLENAGSLTRAAFTYIESGHKAREHYAAKRADEYYRKGLELLGEDDARIRIDALHNHGDVLVLLGRTDEAFAAFREMRAIAYRLGLPTKGGAAHNRIGRLYRDTGSLGQAQQHFEAALSLFESGGDQRGVASCHDDIGRLLWMRGEYAAALDEMRHALEMRKTLGDGRSIALSLNNIGLVWRDFGRVTEAHEALEAALKIRRELNDPLGIVESLNDLGQLAFDQNEPERALALFQEAREVASEVSEHNRIAIVLTNMGAAHLRLTDSDSAIRVLVQAEELCDELGDKLHLAEAKRMLSKAYLVRGDLKRAREAIKRAVDLFGQVRSKPHLAMALRTLGEVTAAGAWGEGHEGKAVDYFLRSIAICQEIGNEFEVAKSYRAFSSYVEGSPHYRHNPDIVREAKKLSAMADEIFARHRVEPSRADASTRVDRA
ncbi:MAG TPA: tetratricopeptide repeat protein [Polyangiaceae bacterium]|nr:tetratricopeptide repeat protein [Polyangiaceae bacterium]